MSPNDWNNGIIEEFRSNGGKVGGRFQGLPLLLLHHRGAKSGIERVNPLAYQPLPDGSMAIFASRGGSERNPDWFHNVRENPGVKVEVGTATIEAKARVAEGEERERIWEKQKREVPGFASYEKKTEREIPVIILEPVG
jgi:deazaflavin-dependent oxidoreductase (nitroreductase family)